MPIEQSERIHYLNNANAESGDYVMYWMQASQRTVHNFALEYAAHRALQEELPLLVCFAVTDRYPRAYYRHYRFMFEGLSDVARGLSERNITFLMLHDEVPDAISRAAAHALLVVTDSGYTRTERAWRDELAGRLDCPLIEVESNVVVPLAVAGNKAETAARTIRPKIHRALDRFLHLPRSVRDVRNLNAHPILSDRAAVSATRLQDCLDDEATMRKQFNLLYDVSPVSGFRGGQYEAEERLDAFVEERLQGYDRNSNDPALDHQSFLSPYLHFGHISPVHIALEVRKHPGEDADAYLEQLIVRRELAMNFVRYTKNYDSYAAIPEWAKKTLAEHAKDTRPALYSADQLEKAETDDPYWNAAQRQMTERGHMHNYMRMYWAKKVLEWSRRPEDAFDLLVELNDRYELDGRDPNGYTGVSWCFGTHDHGWPERDVFGKVRYMNAGGLRRKFDIETYARRWSAD